MCAKDLKKSLHSEETITTKSWCRSNWTKGHVPALAGSRLWNLLPRGSYSRVQVQDIRKELWNLSPHLRKSVEARRVSAISLYGRPKRPWCATVKVKSQSRWWAQGVENTWRCEQSVGWVQDRERNVLQSTSGKNWKHKNNLTLDITIQNLTFVHVGFQSCFGPYFLPMSPFLPIGMVIYTLLCSILCFKYMMPFNFDYTG